MNEGVSFPKKKKKKTSNTFRQFVGHEIHHRILVSDDIGRFQKRKEKKREKKI